ncbi:MAG: hypothetical protein U0132_18620 [Gemmatimonadaceae bacterium]
MRMLRRVAPALALAIIAPLIAEFLLGDFNIRQIGFVAVFIPVYGTGAVLIRELTRRARRGWPTMLLLSLAYALLLEGFANQTLFNPSYAGQRLLDYGLIPALGTSLHFAVYILTLHVVWSLGSAIALAEGLAGTRWREPWLRLPGLIVAAVLTALGFVATVSFTLRTFKFVASLGQFAAVAALALAAIVVAFAVFRGSPNDARTTDPGVTSVAEGSHARRLPAFWLVLVVSLVLSSAFQRWFAYAPGHGVAAGLSLACLLGLDVGAVILFAAWSRRQGWGPTQALAASLGAIVTYGWISLRRLVVAGGTSLGVPTTPVDVIGQAVLLLAMLVLGAMAWRALGRSTRPEGASSS